MHTQWQEREDAKTQSRATIIWTIVVKDIVEGRHQGERARAEGVQRLFEQYASQLQGRTREGNQFSLYENLRGMDIEGKRVCSSQYIEDEEDRLLPDDRLI